MIARVAAITAISSEALALYVVAEFFAAGYAEGDRHAVHAIAFVFVALVGFGLPRLVTSLDLAPRVAGTVTAVAAYMVIYGALRVSVSGDIAIWNLTWIADFLRNAGDALQGAAPAIVGAILLIGLWARSAVRSANEVELEGTARSVSAPLILVTVIIIISAYTDRTGEIGRAGALYYGVTLIALACSQLALSGATFGELRAGGTTALLVGGTLAVTVLGAFVFWIVFGIVGPIIGPPAERVLATVFTVVLTPPAWLIEQLMRLIFRNGGLDLDALQVVRDSGQQIEQGPKEDASTAQKAGGYLLRFVVLAIALGVVVLVVAWYTRFRARARNRLENAGESSSAGTFSGDLRDLFGSFFRRGSARPGGAAPSAAQRLYLEVLAKAEQTGHAREQSVTPEEFKPGLQDAFHTSVTDDITAAFEDARYGGREPDARLIAELEQRWRDHRPS